MQPKRIVDMDRTSARRNRYIVHALAQQGYKNPSPAIFHLEGEQEQPS
jgi:hypothetical protein